MYGLSNILSPHIQRFLDKERHFVSIGHCPWVFWRIGRDGTLCFRLCLYPCNIGKVGGGELMDDSHLSIVFSSPLWEQGANIAQTWLDFFLLKLSWNGPHHLPLFWGWWGFQLSAFWQTPVCLLHPAGPSLTQPFLQRNPAPNSIFVGFNCLQ